MQRGIHIFAFAKDHDAGFGPSICLFLQFFEQNKIYVDFHLHSAQRRFPEFDDPAFVSHFHESVPAVIAQHDFVPRLDLRTRFDQ